MLQTIEALAARVSILEGMQSSIHPTNSKAYSCPVGDCDKSFTRSDHLHRHITKSTDPEHKKKHSVLLERKYCFPCKKPFSRPSDLVRHEKNSHKDFNRFEEDLGDQQLIAKNNEALEKLEENTLHSPHLIGQSIEVQLTAPGLTSGYHAAGQSGDVLADGSGFLNVEDSRIHPSSPFPDSSHVPPSVSYCTGGQAGDASINGSGFFDMEDFHEHSQILPSGSYYTGGQAGDTSTRGSGFFDMEDFREYPQILPSGYCTGEQVSNASTGENGFFDLQDSRIHQSSYGQPHFSSNSQTLCTGDDLADDQAGNTSSKGISFLGLVNLHGNPQTSHLQPDFSYDPRISLNGSHRSGAPTGIMFVSHQQDSATKGLVT